MAFRHPLRFPLMALGMVALLAALWGGLLRLGWDWPIVRPTTLPVVRRHRSASAWSLQDDHGYRSSRLAGGKQSLAVWMADLQGGWLVGRIPGADHCRGTFGAEPLSPDLSGSSGGFCERRRSVRGRTRSCLCGLRHGGAAQQFGLARPDLLASALRHRAAVAAEGGADQIRCGESPVRLF